MMLRALRPTLAAIAFAALAGLAACGSDSTDDSEGASGDDDGGGGAGDGAGGGDNGGGEPSAPEEYPCLDADDCVAVSSTCCECPTFVVNAGSDYAAACDQVECDPLEGCPAVEAACIDSLCRLACSTVPAAMTCANGFATDSFGCLVDVCREPPGEFYACGEDAACVEAPADCCGCELGGVSTAVAAASLDAYIASLGCPPGEPECPTVDVCDSSLIPRCIAQTCTLGPDGGSGGDDDGAGDGDSGDGGNDTVLCGVPEFPPCPKGQVCVLNHPDTGDATRMGVGSCVDA